MAQGNIVGGGAGTSTNGSKVQINQLAVGGRISGGALVERAVPNAITQQGGTMQIYGT